MSSTDRNGLGPCCKTTSVDAFTTSFPVGIVAPIHPFFLPGYAGGTGLPAPDPHATWQSPTYTPASPMVFNDCRTINGFKNVQARKVWHGRSGFATEGMPDTERACSDGTFFDYAAPGRSPDNIKYCHIERSGEASATLVMHKRIFIFSNGNFTPVPASANIEDYPPGTSEGSIDASTSWTASCASAGTVDPNTGLQTRSQSQSGTVTWSVSSTLGGGTKTVDNVVDPNDIGTYWPDAPTYTDGDGTVWHLAGNCPFMGSFGGVTLNVLEGYASGEPTGILCTIFSGPETFTAARLAARLISLYSGSGRTPTCTVEIGNTHYAINFSCTKPNNNTGSEDSSNYHGGTESWNFTVNLGSAYSAGDVIAAATAMLAEWDLTDDHQYPWRTDDYVGMAPLVCLREVPGPVGPQAGWDGSFSPSSFIESNSPYYDGVLLGAPLSLGHVGAFSFANALYDSGGGIVGYGAGVPGYLPAGTTRFTDDLVGTHTCRGGWISLIGSASLPGSGGCCWIQKWAEASRGYPAAGGGPTTYSAAFKSWTFNFRLAGEHNRIQAILDSCHTPPCDCTGITNLPIPDGYPAGQPQGVVNFTCTPVSLPPNACGAGVVCITPNGETFANGVTFPFPGFQAANGVDGIYSCFWQGDVQFVRTADGSTSDAPSFVECSCSNLGAFPFPILDSGGVIPFEGGLGLYSAYGYAFDFTEWDIAL